MRRTAATSVAAGALSAAFFLVPRAKTVTIYSVGGTCRTEVGLAHAHSFSLAKTVSRDHERSRTRKPRFLLLFLKFSSVHLLQIINAPHCAYSEPYILFDLDHMAVSASPLCRAPRQTKCLRPITRTPSTGRWVGRNRTGRGAFGIVNKMVSA